MGACGKSFSHCSYVESLNYLGKALKRGVRVSGVPAAGQYFGSGVYLVPNHNDITFQQDTKVSLI